MRTIATDKAKPALSLILCSRNDEYMGNSRWRLETTLNYVADQVEALGRTEDVEVLVADWGSEVPLRDILRLTPAAARIVSFILIPPEIARPLQKDSPFPEVLALNAAARRAGGTYIGRIDQDTLVGKRFLKIFFQIYDGKRQLPFPLDRALLYSNRRAIPYWFAVRSPKYRHVANFIRFVGQRCGVARLQDREFWTYYVGIWLTHSDIWNECGGYDERFIYYNWMEVEMILRLRQKYGLVDLVDIVDCDFYHLEHRNPRAPITRRKLRHQCNIFDKDNLDASAPPLPYHPNSDAWGLANIELEIVPGLGSSPVRDSWFDDLVSAALITYTVALRLVDKAYLSFLYSVERCAKRARKTRASLRGVHPLKLPRALTELWSARRAK